MALASRARSTRGEHRFTRSTGRARTDGTNGAPIIVATLAGGSFPYLLPGYVERVLETQRESCA